MSEMDDNKTNQFDHMSTEELEQLIRAYAQSTNDADMDDVFSILEVIEKRENLKPSGKYTDVNAAWLSFQKNYRPASCDAESICDFSEVIDNQATHHSDIVEPQVSSTYRASRRVVKHKAILRTACIMLSLMILFFSSTVIAKAFGYDLWQVVAKWTKDTFAFSNTTSEAKESQYSPSPVKYKSLQDALDRYKIKAKLAPTWLPQGYALQSINVNETPAKTTFFANYNNDNSGLTITITSLAKPANRTYEKDNETVTEYSSGGTQYFIMSNLNKTQVVWQTDTFECSISGTYSFDEAKKMIDSIYERT